MLVVDQKLNVLALDITGAISHGGPNLDKSDIQLVGEQVSHKDLDALDKLRGAGFRLALVTTEEGPMVEAIGTQLKADAVVSGAKDPCVGLAALAKTLNVNLQSICFVGDAEQDALAFPQVGLSLAPHDASASALAAAEHVLTLSGGAGAIAEAVEFLLALSGQLDRSAARARKVESYLEQSLDAHKRMLEQGPAVIVKMAEAISQSLAAGGKVLFCGNGGSAADCQHAAAELMGRYLLDRRALPAISLTTDTSVLTAIGNDMEYNEVFSRQVRGLAKTGDVVVGLSTSGHSENILRALAVAKDLGATALSLSGSQGQALRKISDICLAVPSCHTPRIQELHILALHSICALVEQDLFVEQSVH